MQNVAPSSPAAGVNVRFLRTAPVVLSTVDPHALFFAGNVLFKTTTGGMSWEVISPDLSREKPEVPESVGVFRTPQLANQPRRGVIYTVAPSYKDVNVIWAGTDDGLIHVTQDGGKQVAKRHAAVHHSVEQDFAPTTRAASDPATVSTRPSTVSVATIRSLTSIAHTISAKLGRKL